MCQEPVNRHAHIAWPHARVIKGLDRAGLLIARQPRESPAGKQSLEPLHLRYELRDCDLTRDRFTQLVEIPPVPWHDLIGVDVGWLIPDRVSRFLPAQPRVLSKRIGDDPHVLTCALWPEQFALEYVPRNSSSSRPQHLLLDLARRWPNAVMGSCCLEHEGLGSLVLFVRAVKIRSGRDRSVLLSTF